MYNKYISRSVNNKKGTTLKRRIRHNYIKFGLFTIILSTVFIYGINKHYKGQAKGLINTQDIYIEKATVISLNANNNIVSIVDRTGHIYEFKGIENWFIDDKCMVAFGNNGTSNKEDDIILDVLHTQ